MRNRPDGSRSTSVGTSRPRASTSSSENGTPSRPAIAARWITALVEPPMAALTLTASSNASRTMIDDGRTSASTSSTMRCPARCAVWSRRASTAGQVAEYGSCIPSASARHAIVDAVPIVMQ